jgi:uncharacterized protein YggT (Ycf19 family)
MESLASVLPWWVVALDYLLGIIMWTLIGRAAMNLFLPIQSDFFFMKAFVKMTDPFLKAFKPVTPGFLVEPLIPLYVAWFFFIIRFYLVPWLLGYSVLGMLSFPLEGEVAALLWDMFGSTSEPQ